MEKLFTITFEKKPGIRCRAIDEAGIFRMLSTYATEKPTEEELGNYRMIAEKAVKIDVGNTFTEDGIAVAVEKFKRK